MLRFTFRQLEYFVGVARAGGTKGAAERLNVSQSAVSRAVSDLEGLWGVRLFVRQPSQGLQLTSEGRARLSEAERLLGQAERLSGDAQTLGARYVLGYLATLGPRHVAALVARFRRHHPEVALSLVEGDLNSLRQGVARGSLDGAILYDVQSLDARPDDVEILARLTPQALVAQDHPLAAASQVSLAELAQERFILIGLPLSRDYFLGLFAAEGLQPRVVHEVRSAGMVRALVANGEGVSILTTRPAHELSEDGASLRYLALSGRPLTQDIIALFPPASGSAPAFRTALMEIAQQHHAAVR
ncbi:LysR family transcriptional regulator [Sulfitobacter aestuarii]|uniref:LysR family transcriptional regulator n=1 Tax=Sulfitobacter aestuarii TaxID=2161676 RepID=A0ABW5U188_9RHOB